MCPGEESDEPRDCRVCGMSLERNLSWQPPLFFTCAAHPEIREKQPGACPICQRELVPQVEEEVDETARELAILAKRLRGSVLATIPVVFLSMGGMVLPLERWISPAISFWLQAILATWVMFGCGKFLWQRAISSVRHRSPNMFTLVCLGTGAAWLASFFQVRNLGTAHVHWYFEEAAVITTLVILGQWLEGRARRQTGQAISALMNLHPKIAHRVGACGQTEDVPLAAVGVGDILRVLPGELVPADGILTDGASEIDESMISGESRLVKKAIGARVTGATLNQVGTFQFRAEKIGRDTLLAQIISLVSEAQRSHAPIQNLADRVARWFTPAVLVIAALTFLTWFLAGNSPDLAFSYALCVLIIACPCALGLATPMSLTVGIGRAAQQGILIRNAAALERATSIQHLLFDKTGTLTTGKSTLQSITPTSELSHEKILTLAAALEATSEHPLAHAITAAAREKSLELPATKGFSAIPGCGIRAEIPSLQTTYFLGQLPWLTRQLGIPSLSPAHLQTCENLLQQGSTLMFLATSREILGYLALTDTLKPNTADALLTLRQRGLSLSMLTGDHPLVAQHIAQQLQLTDVHAQLSPREKFQFVKNLQQTGKIVAMAGDGINDAPALTQADLSIAMGTGSDIAMKTADITLLHGDLSHIVRALELSRATLTNIRQNLFFSFFYNALGIPLAAGVFVPLFGWQLNPMLGATAMTLSCLTIILNALRLKRI